MPGSRLVLGLAAWVALTGPAIAAPRTLSLGDDEVPFQKSFLVPALKGPLSDPFEVPTGRYLVIQFASASCNGSKMAAVLQVHTSLGVSSHVAHFVAMSPIDGVGSAGSAPLTAYADTAVAVRVSSKWEKASGPLPPVQPKCWVTLTGVLRSKRLPDATNTGDKNGTRGSPSGLLDRPSSESEAGGTIRRSFQCLQKDANGNCTANKCTREQGVGQFDGCSEFANSCKGAGYNWTAHSEGSDAGGTCSVKAP